MIDSALAAYVALLTIGVAFYAVWAVSPSFHAAATRTAEAGLFAAFVVAAFASLALIWLCLAAIFLIGGALHAAATLAHRACTSARPV